jgi:hypothetical protein
MVRVGHTGVNRADFGAFGRIIMSYAFNALIGVDDVGGFSLADSLYRAFRLTGSATDALVGNFISHSIYLLNFSLRNHG